MNYFFYHGHLTHPDLWMLWVGILLTLLNTVGIVWMLLRKGRRRA